MRPLASALTALAGMAIVFGHVVKRDDSRWALPCVIHFSSGNFTQGDAALLQGMVFENGIGNRIIMRDGDFRYAYVDFDLWDHANDGVSLGTVHVTMEHPDLRLREGAGEYVLIDITEYGKGSRDTKAAFLKMIEWIRELDEGTWQRSDMGILSVLSVITPH